MIQLPAIVEKLGERSILVVDDEPQIRQLIGQYLARAQVPARKIVYATDGREALRKIKNQEFGLIIMDVMMPGLDGLEAIKELKQTSVTQDVPIMLVSGNLQNIVVKEAILLGVKHILAKPFGHRFFMERLLATFNLTAES